MNQLVTQRTVIDLVDEYEAKRESIDAELQAFNDAYTRLEMVSSVQGKYVAPISRHKPHIHPSELQKVLLKSGWKAVYDRLQIDRIASAKDKKLFDRTLEDPPELTFDNAKATFGDYLMRPRYHILRGLAEAFADLDRAYKSHSKVKIGVSGLPKRVILSNVTGYGSYGREKLKDILSALAAYRGQPLFEQAELSNLDSLQKWDGGVAGEITFDGSHAPPRKIGDELESWPDRGVVVRKFQNGNAHVILTPATLLDINRALAEFYGEVLPDAEEEDAKHRPGTEVSKDLQFYWSPADVIKRALDTAGIYDRNQYSRNELPPHRVLEPSCGDGRIMDELRTRGCRPFGIEYHAGRAAEARAKGHSVLTGNFLEQPPREDFDFVVMNPPFYGRHYVKHVRHALRFIKPGGTLVAILPATAHYDHKELDGHWEDLPVGSFSEVGTNVPTGILRIRKAKA